MIPPWIAYLVSTSGGFNRFHAQHSSLSGLVVDADMGIAPQSIALAIDFNENENFIFLNKHCPPFVRCFVLSESFSVGTSVNGVAEHVWLGTCRSKHAFFLSAQPPHSSQYRDVAGIIAAGPYSEFFELETLLVKEGGQRVEVEILNSVPNDVLWIPTVPFPEWTVQAELFSTSLPLSIDPAELSLVLPKSIQSELIVRAIQTVPVLPKGDSGVWINCRQEHGEWVLNNEFQIAIRISRSMEVRLNAIVFQERNPKVWSMEDENGNELFFCSNSLRFTSGRAVIGRLLLRSVDGLLFDYERIRVGIVGLRQTAPSIGPMRLPFDSIVPRFKYPTILPMSGGHMVALEKSIDGNLILASRDPTIVDGEWDCWFFFGPDQSYIGQDIGQANHVGQDIIVGESNGISITTQRVVLSFKPATANSRRILSIKQKENILNICVQHSFTQFDLPQARLVTQSDLEKMSDCPICLSPISVGDTVQSMRNCVHAFHSNCVRQWIIKHPSCPTCRSPIETTTPAPAGWKQILSSCAIC